jgi:hypothetical protein
MTALCKEPLEEASNIRVCVRVRPPNQRELALAGGVVVEVGEDQQTVTVTGKVPFVYDVAFPTTIGQLECFSKIGMDIVKTAYNGYNASMFAYGQTSSGKSFSMMGVRGTALVGLIPRIAHLLFTVISLTPEKQFFIEGSFLEIYNEKLRDLLDHKGLRHISLSHDLVLPSSPLPEPLYMPPVAQARVYDFCRHTEEHLLLLSWPHTPIKLTNATPPFSKVRTI